MNNQRTYGHTGMNSSKREYTDVRSRGTAAGEVSNGFAERLGEYVRAKRREKAREPKIVTRRVKAKPFPIGFVFYALMITMVLMFVIYSHSVVNEISYDINGLESKITEYRLENERLSLELEQRNDLKYIEEVASTRLGMVKSTDIVKHYVSISGGDKVVVSEEKTSAGAQLFASLNGLKQSVEKIYG